jgi:hypothetical protein
VLAEMRTDEGSLCRAYVRDGLAAGVVVDTSFMSGSDRFSQYPTEAHTLRNAPIFGIVIAGIRNLKSADWRL